MVHLEFKDLKDLEKIGDGKFGIAYKKDDNTVYKIYHEKIEDVMGIKQDNPALEYKRRKMNKLIKVNNKLKYTKTINDIIMINGAFYGVVMPYFGNTTVSTMINKSFKITADIARQLIRNNKELINNNIYPFDYKSNNLMYVDREVKIIDLDDILTHVTSVPNPLFKKRTDISINDTIINLLRDMPVINISKEISKNLSRRRIKPLESLSKTLEILDERENINNFIIISDLNDIDRLKEVIKNNNYNVIYKVIGSNESRVIENIYDKITKEGIKLFDIYQDIEEDYYFNRYNTKECIEIKNKELIKRI